MEKIYLLLFLPVLLLMKILGGNNMPRGVRRKIEYTGKAAKIAEKIQKLEDELKAAKDELKAAYKEQLKEEKAANKKIIQESQNKLMKAIEASGKTPEEIIALLTQSSVSVTPAISEASATLDDLEDGDLEDDLKSVE